MEHQTILVESMEDLNRFETIIEGQTLLTFDLEGIRLSRTGQPTLATIGAERDGLVIVFLFDLFDETLVCYHEQMAMIKTVLENSSVIKIVHDCRQDSDALNEFLGITLAGVMDTSVYDMLIRQSNIRLNLNRTLESYDCGVNELRTKPADFYVNNPRYWATRPLTEEQKECASADVSFLFQLRDRIMSRVADPAAAQASSEKAADEYRSLRFLIDVDVEPSRIALVIGKKHAGIEKIRNESGAVVNCNGTTFRILAKDQRTADSAHKMILAKLKAKH